jgi:hypothetical protein
VQAATGNDEPNRSRQGEDPRVEDEAWKLPSPHVAKPEPLFAPFVISLDLHGGGAARKAYSPCSPFASEEPMEKYANALTALGGAAGVGALIDLLMYRSEKKKLKARLEDWWLWFSDVSWNNFGRKEAELSIEILDRWAGSRLWSWKRWRFSLAVAAGLFVVCFAVWALWYVYEYDDSFAVFWSEALEYQLPEADAIPGATITFALSLSVTRLIATIVARLDRGPLFNMCMFTLLLLAHLLLLRIWSPAMHAWEALPVILRLYGMDDYNALAEWWNTLSFQLKSVFNGWELFNLHTEHLLGSTAILWTRALELASNGIRIVFALVFLSSFIFRPLVQEPISRLFYGIIDSDKPFFTMLFAGLGVLVAVEKVLWG